MISEDDYAIALMHDTGATAIAKFSKRGPTTVVPKAGSEQPIPSKPPLVSQRSSSSGSSRSNGLSSTEGSSGGGDRGVAVTETAGLRGSSHSKSSNSGGAALSIGGGMEGAEMESHPARSSSFALDGLSLNAVQDEASSHSSQGVTLLGAAAPGLSLGELSAHEE